LDKNCFHAIFIHDFSYEKSQVALQRDDAPSVALLVLERKNPGKRGKTPSLAFFPTSFLKKTCQSLLLTNDAPSMALLVLERWEKCQEVWPDTECRTQ
jgi:hypothetical protein